MVNFGTDISSTSATVKYGVAGGTCDTSSATATRTLSSSTASPRTSGRPSRRARRAHPVLLPPLLRHCPARPAGHRRVPGLHHADPLRGRARRSSFAVFGDWGKPRSGQHAPGERDLADRAERRPAFAVTTGDNAYETGSQKSYGDLYQVGDNTSAVFGPNYWTVAGASLPLFPALGNHDYNNSVLLTGWPRTRRSPHPPAATRPTPTAARTARRPWTTPAAGMHSTQASRASTSSRRLGTIRTPAPPRRSRTTSTTTGDPTPRRSSGSQTTSRPIRGRCASPSGTTRSTRTPARAVRTPTSRDQTRWRDC